MVRSRRSSLTRHVFANRHAAGQRLGARIREVTWTDPVILGLARGGIPVAAEVAAALDAPLNVAVSRKIGAPGHAEFGIGAVTSDGPPYYDRRSLNLLGLSEGELTGVCERERAEAHRRERRYRAERAQADLRDHDVLIVDDGLATGVTAIAALRAVRQQAPRRLAFAAPVCAPDAADILRDEADDVICLIRPAEFSAVGQWYQDFEQTSDEEVIELLAAAAR